MCFTTVPPTIGATDTRYEVNYRNQVTLYCPALGFPTPTIEWLKNGDLLSNNDIDHYVDDDGSLVLLYTSKADSGTYTCRVSNSAGSQELDIELNVYGKLELKLKNLIFLNIFTLSCERISTYVIVIP